MNESYEIRIRGHLDESWADWFNELTIRHEANGDTMLSGLLVDQAALHGVLNRLRDLGIQLISALMRRQQTERRPKDERKASPQDD